MDVQDSYYVAREYMDCRACSGTYISWDSRILGQLSDGVRARFPVLMTRKYACNQNVIALLRSRTLGNSPTALRITLHDIQSEEWLRRQLDYLSCCLRHQKGMKALNIPIPDYPKPTPFPPFPTAKWLLAAYIRDVWSRMDGLLAAATSMYGSILKIDSTKKICKKLQGTAANTATWATNVGNKRGEVLQSVLTSSEGVPALQCMADGLTDQYERNNQLPPTVLYTDRDCCNSDGPSKFQVLFHKWDLCVRMDIWHYMRRLASGCFTESTHCMAPSCPTFLQQFLNGTRKTLSFYVNFQAYILDGINRWNTACSEAAIQSPLTSETLRTFNTRLQSKVQSKD